MPDSVDQSLADEMAEAASNFLAGLEPAAKSRAAIDFGDEAERTEWYYTPTVRKGLPLRDMDPASQRRAHQLLATGLSRPGYVTASTIIGLENTLDLVEGFWVDWYPERGRDPAMYYVTVFGEPGGERWGWRFEGHHVCVHYTVVDGAIASPTPLFFGADPAESPLMGAAVLRPLGSVMDLGREMVQALDDEQRARATISAVAPPDIMLTNHTAIAEGLEPRPAIEMMGRQATPEWNQRAAEQIEALGFTAAHHASLLYRDTPAGLPAAQMTMAQRDVLSALIQQYIERLPDGLAAVESAGLTSESVDAIHFAWAGGAEPGEPHYYRLQGPRFLVEYDCTQRDANHIHSVWRDPQADFGRDLLARHYAASH